MEIKLVLSFDFFFFFQKSDSVDIGECRRTMLVNFDLSLPSPDSKVVLRARLGGKK